jgi:hypothetical protein
MKRIRQLISILLTAALLSGVLCFSGANAANTAEITADYKNLNSKNWMSAIADSRYLCEINLPGSHDSATAYCKNTTNNHAEFFGFPVLNTGKYAKTQSLTLPEQLDAGVRYLDLRFSPKQGELLLCHGNNDKIAAVNTVVRFLRRLNPVLLLAKHCNRSLPPLDTEFYAYEDEACTVPLTCARAFAQIKDFLKDHPSETVIVTAKKENGDTASFLKLFEAQIQSLQSEINPATRQAYLYTENGNGVYTKMPALSQVRGKIILMTPFYEELRAGDMLDAKNKAGTTEYMGMTFRYENHWSVPAHLKTLLAARFLQKFSTQISKDPEQHLSYANVLKTNASFVPLQSPYDIARRVNGCLYAQNSLQKGRYYGWIMGDFMTEEACRAIWQTNYFVFE